MTSTKEGISGLSASNVPIVGIGGLRAMHPPRTAHLLHVFPTFGIGGVPIRISTIINHFGAKYRHTVISLDGVIDSKSRLRDDIDLRFLSVPVDKSRPIATLREIYRTLRTSKPNLLLTYNWGAIEWAFVNTLCRICPHVHLESGFGPEEADRQRFRRILLRRIALAGASHLVTPSRYLVGLATQQWRLDPAKVLYIPNGVDCGKFAAPPEQGALPQFSRSTGELIVGTLAPLRPEKNLGRLLRVFAGLRSPPSVRLLIVGDGPERAKLAAMAVDLNIHDRVIFTGNTEFPEKILSWFDIFAISSDTEQMPNSVLQAMAAGKPIVGVDIGDVKHMIAPENRPFLVPKNMEDRFREAMRQLLDSPSLRTELGARNQAHVRAHYDQQQMFERYGALFDECLASYARL